ncbi:MAG: GGDEF domain-containing protein [Thermoleophilia bacterium]
MSTQEAVVRREGPGPATYSYVRGTARGRRVQLNGRDVAMGWILAAMVTFGVAVGLLFPYLVSPLLHLGPGAAGAFQLACVVAGLIVGGFAYGVARFTLFRANLRLARLAAYDGLTGLYNRQHFGVMIADELERARRSGSRVSLVIADLDHFKRVNDEHGRLAGDDALARVACCLEGAVRTSDAACRIGGEEFAVILPGTGKAVAVAVAERVRLCVREGHEAGVAITVSCGVATYPEDADCLRSLTSRADDAMYAAKAAGRDAVRAWSPAQAAPGHA